MILILLVLSLFTSPVSALGEEAQVYNVTIPANLFKFDPDRLTIRAGDTVRWYNKDERKHVLASVPGSGLSDELEIFSEDDLRSGGSYTHTFKQPGEYPYFCFIHNKMTGVIIVTGK